MKPYAQILASIDTDFSEALSRLRADPLFSLSDRRYTDDDKKRIGAIWRDVVDPFLRTRRIIASLYWRSFFLFGSKNVFVIKYASIVTYYTMVYELQRVF